MLIATSTKVNIGKLILLPKFATNKIYIYFDSSVRRNYKEIRILNVRADVFLSHVLHYYPKFSALSLKITCKSHSILKIS